jgi:hypothetical protein
MTPSRAPRFRLGFPVVLAALLGSSAIADDMADVTQCSIVNLLATPERYVGKKIQTYGYVVAEFEGTAIYLSADDMRHRTSVNGIWLATSEDAPGMAAAHERYALVEGTFDSDRGYDASFGGSLRDITRISSNATPENHPAAK